MPNLQTETFGGEDHPDWLAGFEVSRDHSTVVCSTCSAIVLKTETHTARHREWHERHGG